MGMCRDRGWNATSQQGPKTDTDHTGALPPPHAAHPADPARPDAGWRGTMRVITVCWVLVQAVSLEGTRQTKKGGNPPSRAGHWAVAVSPATPLASAKAPVVPRGEIGMSASQFFSHMAQWASRQCRWPLTFGIGLGIIGILGARGHLFHFY